MKYGVLIIFLFCSFAGLFAQNTEDEIIIEMTGDTAQSAPRPHLLWDYSAPQLTKQWKSKTREELLYTMPIVSDKDRIVSGPKAEYALVEYTDGNDFRKFLFKAETPQTFITAAATAADVLAVNKKYQLNIGLTQTAFENFYGEKATPAHADILENEEILYELSYTDINTPHGQKNWFLFENGKLTQTFYTQQQKDEFIEKRKQTRASLEAQKQQTQLPAQPLNPTRGNTPQKALLYGGTASDQAYMPHVLNPNPKLMQGASSSGK